MAERAIEQFAAASEILKQAGGGMKRDKGLALKDSISTKVPSNLKHFEKDLVRMHHLVNK